MEIVNTDISKFSVERTIPFTFAVCLEHAIANPNGPFPELVRELSLGTMGIEEYAQTFLRCLCVSKYGASDVVGLAFRGVTLREVAKITNINHMKTRAIARKYLNEHGLQTYRQGAAHYWGYPSLDLRKVDWLTKREKQVARLLCKGLGDQAIADELGISLLYTEDVLRQIYHKLRERGAVRRDIGAIAWFANNLRTQRQEQ